MDIFVVTTAEAAFAGGVMGSILTVLMIFSIILSILLIIADWKIFKKAGEPGWKAIIPIYNIYIMYKIVNMRGWWWFMVGFTILYTIVATSIGYNPSLTPEELANLNFSTHPIFIVTLIVFCAVSIYVSIVYAYRTAKVFGHGIGYIIGLLFLPCIFWLILGFGKSKYSKKAPWGCQLC